MEIDRNWLNNYPEIKKLINPVKDYNEKIFTRFDKETCDKIAKDIFDKFNENDKIDLKIAKRMIFESYYARNDKKNVQDNEALDYINIHAKNKRFITLDDLKSIVNKYIGTNTNLGTNLLKDKLSYTGKLKNILKNFENEKDQIEQMSLNIFKEYDKDNSGYLKNDELKNLIKDFYRENNLALDDMEEYLNELIKNYDIDNNGAICFDEFNNYLTDLKNKSNLN